MFFRTKNLKIVHCLESSVKVDQKKGVFNVMVSWHFPGSPVTKTLWPEMQGAPSLIPSPGIRSPVQELDPPCLN